jgi:hypothetical protein
VSPISSLPLFDSDPTSPLERRFREWIAENPQVYSGIVALAREAKARGRRKYAIAALYEVLRWQRGFETTGDSWKLNNDFRAPLARLVMEREPDLAGFFETRVTAAERGDDSESC